MSRVTFNIENDLAEFWYPIMNQNINHVIAPFRDDINKVEVSFAKEPISGKKDSWFRCEVDCWYRNGQSHRNKIYSRDGGQAVTDALSRLKRELVRH